jgi:D-aspartate ligase
MSFSLEAISLDVSVPVVVFSTSRDAIQQACLGVIRSLGRLGVPVYAIVSEPFAPAAVSRYVAGTFYWRGASEQMVFSGLASIGQELSRPAILVPTDDPAAVFIAEHSETLGKWFLFPRLARHLPRRLANKKDLHSVCSSIGIPYPRTAFPTSLNDVRTFQHAKFPVVLKFAAPQARPKNARSVRVVKTQEELFAHFRNAQDARWSDLILQEYIPDDCGEDWIFHGYVNPETDCMVGFTGRKLRSYPPFAGSTTLGVSRPNEVLHAQTEFLLRSISYAGIMDLDYRFDRRDGQYKLLDFNPRIGANFRMFEDRAGMDVVRALHLDLTGRSVRPAPPAQPRTFIAEHFDVVASLEYMRSGQLTPQSWWRSVQGGRELAWFSWGDPAPFFASCAHLLLSMIRKLAAPVWARLQAGLSKAVSIFDRQAEVTTRRGGNSRSGPQDEGGRRKQSAET